MDLITETIQKWWSVLQAVSGQILFHDRSTWQRGSDPSFTFKTESTQPVVELLNASQDGEFRAAAFRGQLFHGKDATSTPSDTTSKGGDATSGNTRGGHKFQLGGAPHGSGKGGDAVVQGGSPGGVPWTATGSGDGGDVDIEGGYADSGDGGAAFLNGGYSNSGDGGRTLITGGDSASGVPGQMFIRGGQKVDESIFAGYVNVRPAFNDPASKNGWVEISAGGNAPNTSVSDQIGYIALNSAIRLRGMVYANIPTAFAVEDALIAIDDSSTATLGAVISGGGGNKVLANHDGSNWRVMAKKA